MKNRLLIYLLLIVMGMSCSSKKEDPKPVKTAEELAIESLAGTSGVDITFTRTSSQLILIFNIPTSPSGRLDGTQALLGSYEIRLNR